MFTEGLDGNGSGATVTTTPHFLGFIGSFTFCFTGKLHIFN